NDRNGEQRRTRRAMDQKTARLVPTAMRTTPPRKKVSQAWTRQSGPYGGLYPLPNAVRARLNPDQCAALLFMLPKTPCATPAHRRGASLVGRDSQTRSNGRWHARRRTHLEVLRLQRLFGGEAQRGMDVHHLRPDGCPACRSVVLALPDAEIAVLPRLFIEQPDDLHKAVLLAQLRLDAVGYGCSLCGRDRAKGSGHQTCVHERSPVHTPPVRSGAAIPLRGRVRGRVQRGNLSEGTGGTGAAVADRARVRCAVWLHLGHHPRAQKSDFGHRGTRRKSYPCPPYAVFPAHTR